MVKRVTINSFRNYLVEEEKTIFFTFGRMNPPTIGHEKLLNKLAQNAGSNPYKVYLSQSQDAEKNPLSYKEKIKVARKMFPKHARQIIIDNKVKTIFDIATRLYEEGYKNISMVVGSDRIREFDVLLNKYNGKKGRHGFYNFAKITVLSAGDRDPDAEGAEGMSASKMRAAAKDGDFSAFSQGLSKAVSNADAKKIYNSVRSGMGLQEQKHFKNYIQFEPVSDIRESYMDGKLFDKGDEVVIKGLGIVGEIKHLGSNYVIVESKGEVYRKWLTDVEKVNPNEEFEYEVRDFLQLSEAAQDPDISDRKGTQPAKYHTGLKKSTKSKRDAQFKKQAKMADDNPAAYKPAPGDADAKTKPSKYTKAYKDMFEAVEHEMTVGGYTTTHFHMCPSAYKAMTKHKDVEGAEQLTKMQDQFFRFEKQFIGKDPSAEDKSAAQRMYNSIMDKAKAADIEKDIGAYMIDHLNSIIKGDPKPGFGKVEEKRVFSSFNEMNEDVSSALKKKSEKSGISVGTLRKVYKRGVAAWKTGHRPGTTPSQWGHARVNAFIVKKKKGGLNHDKDLA